MIMHAPSTDSMCSDPSDLIGSDSSDLDQEVSSPLAALLPHHYRMLSKDSGISDAVIQARGYRSLSLEPGAGYAELKRLGFGKGQAQEAPGLLLPLHTPDGQQPYYVFRADTPSVDKEGKTRKYQIRRGEDLRLDAHPFCHPALKDPTMPLWFTEGQRKEDSLVSRGATACGLFGVWAWKGRNQCGGTTTLADFEGIALQDRHINIVFDSDVQMKPQVRKALERFTGWLQSKGAVVWHAILPVHPSHKIGVDDYFAQGHSLADVESLLQTPQTKRRPHNSANLPLSALRCTENDRPETTLYNTVAIFAQDTRWEGTLGYDAFRASPMFTHRPPCAQQDTPWSPHPLRDIDEIAAAYWLQDHYDARFSKETCKDALLLVAHQRPYHPVRDYLRSLVWDNTPRLDTLLPTYAKTEDSEWTRLVGSKFMISGVARVEEPGCKVDTMPILEGSTGFGKSTFWRILAGDRFFSDSPLDLNSKDAMIHLLGTWFLELGELAAFARHEVEVIKRFLSSAEDKFRLPFERRDSVHPRQILFVGSTNGDHYFKDTTGNRRYWPVKVLAPCDIAALARDRDQLWAEAVVRYRAGEAWHMSGAQEALAQQEQDARMESDPWEEPVIAWIEGASGTRNEVTLSELFTGALQLENRALWTQPAMKRLAAILAQQHWIRTTGKDASSGKARKCYRRPGYIPLPPTADPLRHPVTRPSPPPGNQTGNQEETGNDSGYPVTRQTLLNDETGNRESPYKNKEINPVTPVTPCSTLLKNDHEKVKNGDEQGKNEDEKAEKHKISGENDVSRNTGVRRVTGVTGGKDQEIPPHCDNPTHPAMSWLDGQWSCSWCTPLPGDTALVAGVVTNGERNSA